MNRHSLLKKISGFLKMRSCANFLVFAYSMFWFGCTPGGNPISGTGSQAGNARIACIVYNDDGTPASGAAVIMRTHDYTADTGSSLKKISSSMRDTRTDSRGIFYIDSVDTGNYCIEVNDRNSHALLLTCAINKSDTLVRFPKATLVPTGSIKVNVGLKPESVGGLYLQIYGLERLGRYDNETREIVIDDIPSGSYTLKMVASNDDYRPVEVKNVVVDSSEFVAIDTIDFLHQSQWKYSRKLYFNTARSGADVTGMVKDFPLLVRLDKNNFNFDQASANGSDLRFTKNTTALPYKIELWDAANLTALVRVKIDTIFGNDSSNFITMYWGNTVASDSSNSAAVFDTASGFQGVWHLNENEKTIEDATANGFDGLKTGSPKRVAGTFGYAQHFNGSGDYIEMGNVCNPDTGSFTVGGWIRKTGGKKIQTIISKSIGGPATASYGWLFQVGSDGAVGIFMATADSSWGGTGTFVLNSSIMLTDSAWHHVAVVVNRSSSSDCHVYIDGVDVSSYPAGGEIEKLGKVVNTSPLRIGADANGNCMWNGSLDEIFIINRVQSADYIKLLYKNQSPEDKLLVHGKTVDISAQN